MSEEPVMMWDTKRDRVQAEQFEKYIKNSILNKVIDTIEKYMKTSETICPSILINEIKLVVNNDEESSQ